MFFWGWGGGDGGSSFVCLSSSFSSLSDFTVSVVPVNRHFGKEPQQPQLEKITCTKSIFYNIDLFTTTSTSTTTTPTTILMIGQH